MIQIEMSFSASCHSCSASYKSKSYYSEPLFSDADHEKLRSHREAIKELWLNSLHARKEACNHCKTNFIQLIENDEEISCDVNMDSVRNMTSYNPVDVVKVLHMAVGAENLQQVEGLIENGVSVNSLYNGISPLYLACHLGYEEMAKLLLSNGADPLLKNDLSYLEGLDSDWEARPEHNVTPLIAAEASNYYKIIELLNTYLNG